MSSARTARRGGMSRHAIVVVMAEDVELTVEVALGDLPFVLPQQLGGLRIVLLRQRNDDDEDSWNLDYATIGVDSRDLWVEAEDVRGNEYTVKGRWNSADGELVYGTYTLTPRLHDEIGSLRLLFFLSESEARSGHDELASHEVAAHWVERLQAQLDGWRKRQLLAGVIVASSTRREAIERLTAPPLELSEVEATHVLDLPLGRLTEQGEQELNEDLERVRAHLQT